MHIIDHTAYMNELAYSKSCIEQGNKSYVHYVSDNGLHPVTWLSCSSGKAITFFLTYIGITNKFVPMKFGHLGRYRYFVWPMDYLLRKLHGTRRVPRHHDDGGDSTMSLRGGVLLSCVGPFHAAQARRHNVK